MQDACLHEMGYARRRRPKMKRGVIYDVLYGFVPITGWEEEIINSPFFQRLRWIKQLSFANYIFPGAEHNRFGHTIGVMHSMDQMLRALGLAVPDHELFDPKSTSPEAVLHKSLRIAALMHDIGTFPFSHTVEYAYMRHGNDARRLPERAKNLQNNHEHLGAFIIKNTRYEGGITRILEDAGIDVAMISKIIKGESPYMVANQIMHSDLDADRMDYLLRDSYYTGIQYGQFDRDYILANLTTFELGRGQVGFGVRENAMRAVEDFLIARFNWYSQVIKNPQSSKFDVISTRIAERFLDEDLMYQFHDLLSMVEERDERFFWWNDIYFLNRCQEVRHLGLMDDEYTQELIGMLLFRKAPKTVHHPEFEHRILESTGSEKERERRIKRIQAIVRDFESVIEESGTGKEWILADIPGKDIAFTASRERLNKKERKGPLYLEQEPVKIVTKRAGVKLLIEIENSIVKRLSQYINFVPNVYANEAAMKLFKAKKLL
ncbi:MAG: HD domain-containing protein [Proteobacteria bacterium]|nr:HD domain-containing protein [Pseudomonadota bacterium]